MSIHKTHMLEEEAHRLLALKYSQNLIAHNRFCSAHLDRKIISVDYLQYPFVFIPFSEDVIWP